MRISIILPCHNAAPWIQQALKSIADQTLAAHEIIVINDSSTDGSVQELAKSGVAVRLLEVNVRNAAAARNHGAAIATGDWFAFLDADDYWYKDHLENFAKTVDGSKDVAYFSLLDHETADGKLRYERNTWPLEAATTGLTHQDYVKFCHIDAKFNLNSTAVRRDRFEEIGGFEVSQLRRHDRDMWLRAIHGKTWAYNPQSAGVHRSEIIGSVSNANWANSSYYRLRMFARNRELYASADYDRLVKQAARSAMSVGLLVGKKKDRQEIYELAKPYLSRFQRFFFVTFGYCPGAYRLAHNAYMSCKGNSEYRLSERRKRTESS